MTAYDLMISRRTIRQFKRIPVGRGVLEKIINAARLAPSAANLQPLEFIAVDETRISAEIYPCLHWAAYIAPRGDPKPGQEPAAYVVVLVNQNIRKNMFEYDVGASVENMILAALEEGIGACWLLSIERERIMELLKVPADYRVDSVLALGYPAEQPVTEELRESPKYWKDEAGVLHVPKRSLGKVLHFNSF
jgi:nitroreductase